MPELRAGAASFWARERHVGAAVRRDADVRVAAERVGLGFVPPSVLGSQDHVTEEAKGRVGERGQGGGALHTAARGLVATLKLAALRPPSPT